MAGDIRRCPKCRIVPVVRRANGSRITGFVVRADYVGYLRVGRHFRATRAPVNCVECGSVMEVIASAQRE